MCVYIHLDTIPWKPLYHQLDRICLAKCRICCLLILLRLPQSPPPPITEVCLYVPCAGQEEVEAEEEESDMRKRLSQAESPAP